MKKLFKKKKKIVTETIEMSKGYDSNTAIIEIHRVTPLEVTRHIFNKTNNYVDAAMNFTMLHIVIHCTSEDDKKNVKPLLEKIEENCIDRYEDDKNVEFLVSSSYIASLTDSIYTFGLGNSMERDIAYKFCNGYIEEAISGRVELESLDTFRYLFSNKEWYEFNISDNNDNSDRILKQFIYLYSDESITISFVKLDEVATERHSYRKYFKSIDPESILIFENDSDREDLYMNIDEVIEED